MKENKDLTLTTLFISENASKKDFFHAVSELKEMYKKLVFSFSDEKVEVTKYQKASLFSKKYPLVKTFADFIKHIEKEDSRYPLLIKLEEKDKKLLFEFSQKSNSVIYHLAVKPKKDYNFYPSFYGSVAKETGKYLENLSIFDTKRYDIITNTNYPEDVRIKELYKTRA